MIYRGIVAAAGVVVLALLVAACATPVAETPAQRVYALSAEYGAALELAAAYADLPDCPVVEPRGAPGGEPGTACADAAVLARLQQADRAAAAALGEARRLTLALPEGAGGADAALAAAEAAIGALQRMLAVGVAR